MGKPCEDTHAEAVIARLSRNNDAVAAGYIKCRVRSGVMPSQRGGSAVQGTHPSWARFVVCLSLAVPQAEMMRPSPASQGLRACAGQQNISVVDSPLSMRYRYTRKLSSSEVTACTMNQ